MKYYHNHDFTYKKLYADNLQLQKFLFQEAENFDFQTMEENLNSVGKFVKDILHMSMFVDIKNILIVGCGTGDLAFWLASRGFNVLGIDVSIRAIEIANQRLLSLPFRKRINFLNMDVTLLSIDNKFDLIIDDHCLHCLVDNTDRALYYQKVREHLKPNAHLMIETIFHEDNFIPPENFILDDGLILWQKTNNENDSYFNKVMYRESYYIPVRKLIKSYDFEQEILKFDLKLIYFVFRSDLRVQLQTTSCSLQDPLQIPAQTQSPAVVRAIASRCNHNL
ncbi:MAG: class I SAM-dependent methyltransferase [Oligoflexia bacterium]|nr:class I SAM-dependent methyltransferase [Oligoflexia bacterium]